MMYRDGKVKGIAGGLHAICRDFSFDSSGCHLVGKHGCADQGGIGFPSEGGLRWSMPFTRHGLGLIPALGILWV